MRNKVILIVGGEPNSIFLEIFFKALIKNNFKKPIILKSIYLIKVIFFSTN